MNMKAMVLRDFGGPELFETKEMSVAEPGPRQLLVKVHATSVNPVDYKIRKAGAAYGIKVPVIVGFDVSGVVRKTGSAAQDFKVGDEVFYSPMISGDGGTYAEFNVIDEALVAFKPRNLSHIEAAGIPLAGGTAWDALVTRGRLQAGETVLVHAGAGGVGSLAVQIAKAAGARVLATCRRANIDLLEKLGADVIIDYRAEDYVEAVGRETQGEGVDLVFDTVGIDTMARSVNITKPFGRIVGIVDTDVSFRGAYRKNLTFHLEFSPRYRAKLDFLRVLLERGQLKPVIDSVMPLEKVAEAHKKLEQGGVRGKIILEVSK
jgi:NADPH2:quinone reductase